MIMQIQSKQFLKMITKKRIFNGSVWMSIVGGLIALSDLSNKEEKIKRVEDFPYLYEDENFELVKLVASKLVCFIDKDYENSIEDTLSVLQMANEYGGFGSKMASISDRLPGYYGPVLLWFSASNEEQATLVAQRNSILLSDEAIDFIETLLSSEEPNLIFAQWGYQILLIHLNYLEGGLPIFLKIKGNLFTETSQEMI